MGFNDIEMILSYPRLKERLENRPGDRLRVLSLIEEIEAKHNTRIVSLFCKIIAIIGSYLYSGFNITFDEGVDLDELVKNNNLIFVPNHQSHADYIALNFWIFKNYRFPLHIAGGVNLNIFPIGPIFRRMGCFFIRRRFNSDILYRLTIEAYLYYLLKNGNPIEFFFEGGRSRTGKLLPPRFGLYQMILDAHKLIDQKDKKPLMFLPVSIAHEYIPEQRTMAKEVEGAKKKKEKTWQLLKVFKVLTFEFGKINLHFSAPILSPNSDNSRAVTHKLAFDCFFKVGKSLTISPSSLLSLLCLDEPSMALSWIDLKKRAIHLVKYCRVFDIPLSSRLVEDKIDGALEEAIELFSTNGKLEIIGNGPHSRCYYLIKREARMEMLYFKNMILHHFLVPSIVARAWWGVFSGKLLTPEDLRRFFVNERSRLKHEFYLPSVKVLLLQSMKVLKEAIGREVTSFEEIFIFGRKDLFEIALYTGIFSRFFNHIHEGHFIVLQVVENMAHVGKMEFSMDDFNLCLKEIRDREFGRKHIVRYQESFSKPILENGLKNLTDLKVLDYARGIYTIIDHDKVTSLLNRGEGEISESLSVSFVPRS